MTGDDLADQDLQLLLEGFLRGEFKREGLVRQLRERGMNARVLADSYDSLADTLASCDKEQAKVVAATGLMVGQAALDASPN